MAAAVSDSDDSLLSDEVKTVFLSVLNLIPVNLATEGRNRKSSD